MILETSYHYLSALSIEKAEVNALNFFLKLFTLTIGNVAPDHMLTLRNGYIVMILQNVYSRMAKPMSLNTL